MKPYQRFFGSGPIGLVAGAAVLLAAVWLQPLLGWPAIHGDRRTGAVVFLVASVLSGALLLWSLISLPPWSRGTRLVSSGVFRHLRHPLYSSFILFSAGLAVWLDNWIFVAWALLQLPLWRLSVVVEERLMRQAFPGEYEAYCGQTRRFIPGIW